VKVLVTGAGGQLGKALVAAAPPGVRVAALDRRALDIANPDAIVDAIDRHAPELVINAAAYTAVDRAETEEDNAMRANGDAVGHLAAACAAKAARLIHISTDYVFDGTASTPYRSDAPTAPLSAYGRSKLAGERQMRGDGRGDGLIVRTSWVYAAGGGNFVSTMLRLMAEREELRVVADQVGTPTHAASLARALWQMASSNAEGIVHWTDAGAASWYDFAEAIRDEALANGLLTRAATVIPIPTAEYPTPARRPAYALLDKASGWAIGGAGRHWRTELREALANWNDPA